MVNDLDDWISHLGPELVHVTMTANLPQIETHGLLSARSLALRQQINPADLALRSERRQVGNAILNHQLPILHGLKHASQLLDGYSPLEWAEQLDGRVYLHPSGSKTRAFVASLLRDGAASVLRVSTKALFEIAADRVDVAPINTGNFRQGGAKAPRGDWIYCPVTAGVAAFRHNRVKRGLVKTLDTVREVSIRGDLPQPIWRQICLGSRN